MDPTHARVTVAAPSPCASPERSRAVGGEQEALPILFTPCAWHESPAELARLNREFPGQVSHSMCDACLLKFEAGA